FDVALRRKSAAGGRGALLRSPRDLDLRRRERELMALNDPDLVAEEYATATGLEGRAAAYKPENVEGPDANEIALDAVAEASPARVLEVGCGWGAFAAAVVHRTGAELVAVDISPRMV